MGILASRLVYNPLTYRRLSFLLGAGAGISTETNFLHSYGVDGLVGAKVALTDNTSLRVDGVMDWLANESWKRWRCWRCWRCSLRRSAPRCSRTSVGTRSRSPWALPWAPTQTPSESAIPTAL